MRKEEAARRRDNAAREIHRGPFGFVENAGDAEKRATSIFIRIPEGREEQREGEEEKRRESESTLGGPRRRHFVPEVSRWRDEGGGRTGAEFRSG